MSISTHQKFADNIRASRRRFGWKTATGLILLLPNLAQALNVTPADCNFNDPFHCQKVLNPFGQAWNERTTNPDIPVAISISARGSDITPDQQAFISKASSPFVFLVFPTLGQPGDDKNLTIANKLKSANPALKILGYTSVVKGDPSRYDFSNFKENWFVHKKGTDQTSPDNRILQAESGYLMDVTNPEYQDYAANALATRVTELHLDGILDDWTGFNYPAYQCCLPTDTNPACPKAQSQWPVSGAMCASPNSVPQGFLPYTCCGDPVQDIPATIWTPSSSPTPWEQGMTEIFSKLKKALGPDKFHIYNAFHVGNKYLNDLSFHRSLLQYADGVWFENAALAATSDFSSGQSGFKELQDLLDLSQSLGKYSFFVFNSATQYFYFNKPSFPNGTDAACFEKNRALQQQIERYFLAFYLTFYRDQKTPLIYYTPIEWGEYFESQAYFSDWDLRLGEPLSAAQEISPRVFRRGFQNGEVWWNNSSTPFHISKFSSDLSLKTADGNLVSSYTLLPANWTPPDLSLSCPALSPQGAGMIFMRVGSPLATPTISFPKVMRLGDTLEIKGQYQGPVTFQWTFSPMSEGSTLSGAPSIQNSYARERGINSSFYTLSPEVLQLQPGIYNVSVVAKTADGLESTPAHGVVTLVADDFQSSKVFPNPWRANLHAGTSIGFTHLTLNSTVKLFTISGRWVRTLAAPLGSTMWDGRNVSGENVASGVYLYVVMNDLGEHTHGKVVILR